jgi:maltose O-acetyltransferase
MPGWLLEQAVRIKDRIDRLRVARRWATLRARGMRIGDDVWLPASTWIDTDHCHLISIGDHTGLGEECMILAHDAQMDEFLDAARIGRVDIRESCHIGARCVVLPGVQVGPRTIVGANSVISRSLPPDTVCAGSPARVLTSLEDYLQRHREQIGRLPNFAYDLYDARTVTVEHRMEMVEAVARSDAYVVGGRSAELAGRGGTPRTRRG